MESSPPVTIEPRFWFGIKGELRNNIYFLDEQRILYPWGHNIVILSIGDDKVQEYIPGIEGSEGITALSLSHQKNYLAVWERAERAIWCIYDINTHKRRKVLTSDYITDKEFISVAFSHQNEKGHLVTLTGGQDGMIILWQWNKSKWIAFQKVGISEGQTLYQASFNNLDFNSLIVTGNGVYKYYKLKDNGIRPEHSAITKKEAHISNHYTCHTWLPEGKIIIWTDQGELLLLESTGEYKMMLSCSPGDGFYIESITTYSKGFMIAGDTGQIMVFEKTDEPKKPFAHVATWPTADSKEEQKYPNLLLSVMANRIKCIALSSNEDTLVFSTEENQLMKVNVNLDMKINESSTKYQYLIYPFHSREITGLDWCIKKNLVVTCSIDKTVRIWNYSNPPRLEIWESFQDEAYSVAFHPSGYHIVVGFTDKVRIMNVFSEKRLGPVKEIPIKSCREIQFSNGGHLFAWVNQHYIQVYNFYTGENPPSMIFNEHDGKVRCISWFEDDSGFVSAGWDGKIYVWNIKNNQKPEYYFESKGTNFSWVAKMPNAKTVFAVGADKTVREISYKIKEDKNESSVSAIISSEKESKFPIETKEKLRFLTHVNYSQVALLNGGRGLVVGTAEDDRPGMVIVYRLGMERWAEIQAHSLPIERIKLSFDNTVLFSASKDGSFFIFDLKDPLMKKDKETPSIQLFEDILFEKSELRELLQAIEHLRRENEQLKQHKQIEQKRIEAAANEKLEKLKEDRDNNKREAEKRKRQLEQEIAEMDKKNKEDNDEKRRINEDELDKRRRDFEEKKEQDKLRYQELSQKMEEEQRKISEQMAELTEDHKDAVQKLIDDNHKELKKLSETADRLRDDIKRMETENKKIRDDVETMYWNEIDAIKERNKNELYKVTREGMNAKAELTLTSEKYTKSKAEKEGYEQNIKEKQGQLNNEIQKQETLKSEIENQRNEISERKKTIAEKENRIFQLKKKTQELEKFKFVLDYKIKELKRDINPKEAEIAKLNEQTTKMTQELNHFRRVNENLALIVDDLKMRQEGLQKEIKDQKEKLETQDSYIKKFNDDLYDSMKTINNYKDLKSSIVGLHKKYVLEEVRTNKGEADLQKEYAANRKYLEKSVNYLRLMITKDSTKHRKEYTNYMKENVTLLQEINDLRKQVKELDMQYRLHKDKRTGSTMGSRFSGREDEQEMRLNDERARDLKEQDIIIDQLTNQLQKLEEDNVRARSSKGARKLPPIERKLEDNEEAKIQDQDEPEEDQEEDQEEDPRVRESEKRLDDFKDDEEPNKEGEEEEEGEGQINE